MITTPTLTGLSGEPEMRLIDRNELRGFLHNKLMFTPKKVPALRVYDELTRSAALNQLLEALLDEIYRGNAVLIRPDSVVVKVLTSPLAFGNVQERDGVFGEDEPHPCPGPDPSQFRHVGR